MEYHLKTMERNHLQRNEKNFVTPSSNLEGNILEDWSYPQK